MAPIYSYSKSKGLFAGVSFEGSVLIARNDANRKFYGGQVTPSDILTGKIDPPPEAASLYQVLDLKFGVGRNSNTSDEVDVASPPMYQPAVEQRSSLSPTSKGPPPSLPTKRNDLQVKRARALYDFVAVQPGDLSFKKGDILSIKTRTVSKDDWWVGILNDGTEGQFPGTYVQEL